MINKRKLGKSGIELTEIGLGLWAIGGKSWGPTDDRESLNTIDAALDAGVNFFDTADVYGDGHSEILLGRAMQGRRDQFIVATKIGWIDFDEEGNRSQYDSSQKIVAAVEDNLRRLGTDYVDLIQCHIGFREKNMEHFVKGFQDLQDQGKIRAYGLSTSDFDYIKAFNADGRCSSLQIDYSILNRTPERDIFPYCQENEIGVLIRGPLAMGVLTGKFDRGTKFAEGDFRTRWTENADEYEVFMEDLSKVERLRTLANSQRSLAQLALQFSIHHPAVSSTIPGAKTVDQLMQNLAIRQMPTLSETDLRYIDSITEPGGGRKIWPA